MNVRKLILAVAFVFCGLTNALQAATDVINYAYDGSLQVIRSNYNDSLDATCVLEHCIVEYAGRYSGGYLIRAYHSSPVIRSCTLRHSQGYGVYASQSSATVSNCTISDCGGSGIYWRSGAPTITGNGFTGSGDYDLNLSSVPDAVVTGNTVTSGIYVQYGGLGVISGNTINYDDSHPLRVEADDVGQLVTANTFNNVTSDSYIEVTGGTIVHDASWPAVMPYKVLSDITVQGTDGPDGVTTLTIAAGAELRFDQGRSLYVGNSYGDPGALVARGTEDDKIVFTSAADPKAAGDWRGIEFRKTADTTCVLEHCVIEYAGQYSGGYLVRAYHSSPVIRDCILRHGQGYGVYVESSSSQIVNCSITDTGVGIYVHSGTPFIQANKLEGNREFGVKRPYPPEVVAEENWWGHTSGPYHETKNPDGQGDKVSDNVDFDPWVVDPADMDIDGLPDAWEKRYFGDITTVDETTDYDSDGLSDSNEYTYDTDPTNTDTDGDGKTDGEEVSAGTDPKDPASN